MIDLIRGENVSRALAILKFTDKRAAGPIEKTLRSAIANATYLAEQQNIAVDPDDLWVKTCFVDMGAHKNRRRMRPAPQGRAYRETRHYCHITIAVTSDDKPKTEKELKAEAAKAKKATEAPKKKAPAKKAAPKKAKAEEVETPVVDAPVEELVETVAAENAAEVADAKNASTAAEAESNATQTADDKQQDINEELEKQ